NTELHILNAERLRQVELTDMNGRIIKSLKVNESTIDLTISDLIPGAYVVKGWGDTGVKVGKVLITKN
ncbi:MAG TPA: T9SS type A sorting domain-containing protein, partial [Saprospiraceae bacterium]|nr:T9SS type A sorting domain-containing protein [Saprospiraceae bacterium]